MLTVDKQKKTPVDGYFYSEDEWNRLGCGPLPAERDRARQHETVHSRGNPPTDNNHVKGYN